MDNNHYTLRLLGADGFVFYDIPLQRMGSAWYSPGGWECISSGTGTLSQAVLMRNGIEVGRCPVTGRDEPGALPIKPGLTVCGGTPLCFNGFDSGLVPLPIEPPADG